MRRLAIMALLVLVLAGTAHGLETEQYAVQPLWLSDWGWASVAIGDSVTWDLTGVVADKITFTCDRAGSLYVWNSSTKYTAPSKAWRFGQGDVLGIAVKDPDSLKVWVTAGTVAGLARYMAERR